ncbi:MULTISPECIES: hypothetical protein [Alteromonas]|nr:MULTISPECIES: hypothetical protein [Alteromonas]
MAVHFVMAGAYRLFLSPYIDTDCKVIESTTGKNNKPTLSSTYQLDD